MYTFEELTKLFEKTFGECETYNEISDKLHAMEDNENVCEFRRYLCNELLYLVSMGYTKYDGMNFEKNNLIELLCKNIVLLPKDNYYYRAVYAYFKHDDKKCLKYIEDIICLNSPTKQLIEKVHNDKRMKLFEYQISYTEI